MMSGSASLRSLLAALPAAVALSGAGLAADLFPPPPPEAAFVEAATESGWYLRGDATVANFDHPADATRPDPNDPGMPPLIGLRLGNEAGYGGGVGYQVNDWLRVDATIDQRLPAPFRAYSSRSVFATGYNVEAGELSVLTGLFNVYADLGTWWGFTPYVGGGLGFADNAFRKAYTQTTCTTDACDGQLGTGPRAAVLRPGHSLSTFAWGLTAGLSYRISGGLSIDTAYRYVDVGSVKSGADAYGFSTRLKDVSISEFRIGLRYRFAGGLLPFTAANPYGN